MEIKYSFKRTTAFLNRINNPIIGRYILLIPDNVGLNFSNIFIYKTNNNNSVAG